MPMVKIHDNKKLAYLLIIIILFLSFRIPLLSKPLQHDEIRNTFAFLNSLPFVHSHPNLGYEFGWANDWQGQLAIHPPFLSAFYYLWIRIFGDSEISLHIPTLIFGMAGIILFYYIGVLLFGAETSFFALLATTLSVSHIGFSTMTVHAIFECFILGASLLCLIKLLTTKNRNLLRILFVLNIFGLLIFYHYFVYLLLQTVILWRYRDRLVIPRYCFIGFVVAVIGFFCWTVKCYFAGHYAYSFWMQDNITTFISTIMWLPFGYAPERVVTPTAQILSQSFCFVLFVTFIWGVVDSIVRIKDRRDGRFLFRAILITIFFTPFLVYLLVGLLTKTNFGNSRNFFYLLPVYFLFIFGGLTRSAAYKKILYALFSVFFTAILAIAIAASPVLWKYKFLEKEMPRLATGIDVDFSIFVTDDYFIYAHYVKKYGIQNKSFLFASNTPEEPEFLSFLDERISKMPDAKTFAIIGKLPSETPGLKNRYLIRNKTFELTKTESYEYAYLPFRLLRTFIKRPLTITIFIFSRR